MFGDKFFRGTQEDMQSLQRAYAPLNRIEAYWQGLRDGTPGGTGLPARTQIDPRGIGQDLRHAFIIERIAPEISKIRVSGCVLSDMVGCEARGLPFSRAFDAESQATLAQTLRDSFDGPATACLKLMVPRRGMRGETVGEMRLFPLLNTTGTVTRLLGAMAFAGRAMPAAQPMILTGTFLREVRARGAAQGQERKAQLRPTHVPYLKVLCMED
ncbi:MAG: PAS domain-containing protein [Rhodobacteraceae bacterium]|nr:PAS domain-containing protein [Paracoccaceae bacterium]